MFVPQLFEEKKTPLLLCETDSVYDETKAALAAIRRMYSVRPSRGCDTRRSVSFLNPLSPPQNSLQHSTLASALVYARTLT